MAEQATMDTPQAEENSVTNPSTKAEEKKESPLEDLKKSINGKEGANA